MEKMKAASLVPRKFRSVRDKNGSHRRNKSSEPHGRVRPLTTETFLSIFRPEAAKQAQREKEEEEKEAAKVEEIGKRLQELNYNDISDEVIRYALNSKFANGDADKAIELLQIQQKAFAGIIEPYNPDIQMLGAENRGSVTCYLDALFFAMFAKLSAFECMLKNDSTDESQRKLAALIRLWVNMLRSGKLIHTDTIQHIQEALAACGWKDAQLLEQQDTSEAFAFITETLQLPLLTLQVDLFHQGKKDVDDHKVVHERLLNLAVPPDPDRKGIKLEDCLEEYFNNKVDVLRDSLEEKKANEEPGGGPKTTIRLITEDAEAQTPEREESPQLPRRWTVQSSLVESPVSTASPSTAKRFEAPSVPRHRSTSIIQRIVVGQDTKQPHENENETLLQKAKRTGSTVVKAVTIPAWQFFRLIPWNATSNGQPQSDVDVAHHFNQRPVLGICLKRYTMTEQGVPVRQNTLIDIPDSLRLPHFMVLDDGTAEQEPNGLSQEYKLVLQSVVCHRGDSLHSGHYVAFARVAPKLLTDNRRYEHDPPPDYEEAQWAKFDDLAVDNRVTYVDDIKQSLAEEMPYLLFYQIVPMVDVSSVSTDGSVTEPPSYNESASKASGAPPTPLDQSVDDVAKRISGYFDSSTTLVHSGGGPSIRFSSELERPFRLSIDEDHSGNARPKSHESRRDSINLAETMSTATGTAPTITTSEAPSPQITPQDESTAARLSRAAAKFKAGSSSSKSRPNSQAGEGRKSLTMSRFGFGRPNKDGGSNASATRESIVGAIEALDENAVIVEEENGNNNNNGNINEEKDKEKPDHHHLMLHHTNKKDRAKSKSRGGADKDEKDSKKEGKGKGKTPKDVPDRECAVM